ncbi:hypothetical protein FPV67DRAFT_1504527 [Lyophyllum atratum]|nr:hypothetical protein FPV67DRAFT_1504527 [Lyophyllum atratum]
MQCCVGVYGVHRKLILSLFFLFLYGTAMCCQDSESESESPNTESASGAIIAQPLWILAFIARKLGM